MRIISSTHLRLGLIGLALFVVLGANDQGFRSIFDGTSGKGWILCDGKPLPKAFVQPEGLNPHGTGKLPCGSRHEGGRFRTWFKAG